MPNTDWDDAYANAAHIAGADDIAARWADAAPAFRTAHPPQVLPYGPAPRQTIDIFRPKQAEQGLTIFIHGGYWKAFSGRHFSHLAAGPLAHGQVVAVPTYTLAPDATIDQIVGEMVRAVTLLAQTVPGPIRLTGHSAGGHLATRLACQGMLPADIAARIVHVLSISGVHDLRPLLATQMRDTLRLTPESATADSPALHIPQSGLRLTAMVGADERPEFLRQTDLLANIWAGLGADCRAIHLPGHNHFTVVDELARPDGAITRAILAD